MKKNIIKDLKRMGLVPTNKQFEHMKIVAVISVLVLMLMLALYGMWKYPLPPHYFENMNYPANHYHDVAFIHTIDDVPECGNDIYHKYYINKWKYHNVV
mgnify:CR=1 FL=1